MTGGRGEQHTERLGVRRIVLAQRAWRSLPHHGRHELVHQRHRDTKLPSGRDARLDLQNFIFTRFLRERGIEVPRKPKLFGAKSAIVEPVVLRERRVPGAEGQDEGRRVRDGVSFGQPVA